MDDYSTSPIIAQRYYHDILRSMMALTCHLSTCESEADMLTCYKASLSYIARPCLKTLPLSWKMNGVMPGLQRVTPTLTSTLRSTAVRDVWAEDLTMSSSCCWEHVTSSSSPLRRSVCFHPAPHIHTHTIKPTKRHHDSLRCQETFAWGDGIFSRQPEAVCTSSADVMERNLTRLSV